MNAIRVRAVAFTITMAAGLMFAPLAAHAGDHYSWQGGDYSYSYKSTTKMQVSDRESDGRWVYADYYVNGSETRHKLNNKSGSGTNVYRSVGSKPYKHRAVEAIPVVPNAYGSWDYPDEYTF